MCLSFPLLSFWNFSSKFLFFLILFPHLCVGSGWISQPTILVGLYQNCPSQDLDSATQKSRPNWPPSWLPWTRFPLLSSLGTHFGNYCCRRMLDTVNRTQPPKTENVGKRVFSQNSCYEFDPVKHSYPANMASTYTRGYPWPQPWLPVLTVYFVYVFACKVLEGPLSPTTPNLSFTNDLDFPTLSTFSTGLWLPGKGNPSKLSLTFYS